jgi:hypothetical protein
MPGMRLTYYMGKDGSGVIKRFTCAAESAAARLGFKATKVKPSSIGLIR